GNFVREGVLEVAGLLAWCRPSRCGSESEGETLAEGVGQPQRGLAALQPGPPGALVPAPPRPHPGPDPTGAAPRVGSKDRGRRRQTMVRPLASPCAGPGVC